MPTFFKSVAKGSQSVGYGVATVGAGVGAVAMGTVTIALGMTGVGVPLAVPFAGLTYASAMGTVFCARKTAHKAHRAVGHHHHEDSSQDVEFSRPGKMFK